MSNNNKKVLLALIFVLGAAVRCYAQEPPAAAAAAPQAKSHPTPHRTPEQAIDANVRRLARGLKLDQEQQGKLREILVDQYAQLMKLRTESAPGTDRAGVMRAIVDRTRERIREMLSDEQKKQYAPEVPREVTAATRADLEHWLDVRDAQRKEDTEESK